MEEKYTFFVENHIWITQIDNKFLILESKEKKLIFEFNEEYFSIRNKCRWSIMNMHLYFVILIVKWMDLEIIEYWRHFFVTYKGKWTESTKQCISSKI